MSNEKIKKYRNYSTIVYPESAPEKWMETLSDAHIPAFISPMHDKDVNDSGESKKPHYHVMIMFEGPCTSEKAESIFKKIGGVGNLIVESKVGHARYLCHLDSVDKYKYDIDDVISLGGADYFETIATPKDKFSVLDEIIEYCEENKEISYHRLMNYARAERREWRKILYEYGAKVVLPYIKSMAWEMTLSKD